MEKYTLYNVTRTLRLFDPANNNFKRNIYSSDSIKTTDHIQHPKGNTQTNL